MSSSERRGVKWVRQEDAEGCGVAVLAMLTGEPYAAVRARIDAEDFHGHSGDWSTNGITHITLDRYLTFHGFYRQRIYEAWRITEAWPPKPWAPVHFAQVVQPSNNTHFVVMDAEGHVLDPMREGTFSLADWPAVNNVAGLVKP